MSTDTPKPTESAAIAAQRAAITRMKDAVLPPSSGVDVGGLALPTLPADTSFTPPDALEKT
ncbi:MAG: hypothetical protein E6J45_14230 [Chloroflexi bacterium]|nr:MAG: hypothetical protein E6J45_14230 [Chloroflexota bacterium]